LISPACVLMLIACAALLAGCASNLTSTPLAPRLPTAPVSSASISSQDWQTAAQTYSEKVQSEVQLTSNWLKKVEQWLNDADAITRSPPPK
jgi:PBP1b-binding outer membrane lipoprotein LpoB